jgi:hypothetical protein
VGSFGGGGVATIPTSAASASAGTGADTAKSFYVSTSIAKTGRSSSSGGSGSSGKIRRSSLLERTETLFETAVPEKNRRRDHLISYKGHFFLLLYISATTTAAANATAHDCRFRRQRFNVFGGGGGGFLVVMVVDIGGLSLPS